MNYSERPVFALSDTASNTFPAGELNRQAEGAIPSESNSTRASPCVQGLVTGHLTMPTQPDKKGTAHASVTRLILSALRALYGGGLKRCAATRHGPHAISAVHSVCCPFEELTA